MTSEELNSSILRSNAALSRSNSATCTPTRMVKTTPKMLPEKMGAHLLGEALLRSSLCHLPVLQRLQPSLNEGAL